MKKKLLVACVFSLLYQAVSGLSLEPPTIGCYLGVYLGCGSGETCYSIDEFNEWAGKPHSIFPRYVDIKNSKNLEHSQWAKNAPVPMFFYMPNDGLDKIKESDVQNFAQMCKQLDKAIMLVFGHEMNGSWYAWGNQPLEYKREFKKVAEIFHEISPKVKMCWVPNQNWGYPWGKTNHGDGYSEYYPEGQGVYGDYVDWVGLNFYERDWDENGEVPPGQFEANIKNGQDGINFYEIFSIGKNKPMLIAETAAFDPDAVDEEAQKKFKDDWIAQVYNEFLLKTTFPKLHAICYFHVRKQETIETQNINYPDKIANYRIPEQSIYKDLITSEHFLIKENKIPDSLFFPIKNKKGGVSIIYMN